MKHSSTPAVLFVAGSLVLPQPLFAQTTLPNFPSRSAPKNQSSAPATGVTSVFPNANGYPIVAMTFPIIGKVEWTDSYFPNGENNHRQHHGEDLMAPKMTRLVAVFAGTVRLRSGGVGGHYMIFLHGDNGIDAIYCHVNNDTPGTNDGLGGDKNAFAPGLKSGDRVAAGQFIGYVGDSGNAENGPSHCHLELSVNGVTFNPAPSLRAARRIKSPAAPPQEPKPDDPDKSASSKTTTNRGKVVSRTEREANDDYRVLRSKPGTNRDPNPFKAWNVEVFADFESGNYDGWTLKGTCWGRGPAPTDLFPGQITGQKGLFYINTLVPDTFATGTATSRDFTIRHQAITFWIGGGNYPTQCFMRLVVNGETVVTETGDDSAELKPKRWDVIEWMGKTAHLEIVDASHSPHRGYLMVDNILFCDPPGMKTKAPITASAQK